MKIAYEAERAYFIECVREKKAAIPGALEGWMNIKVVDAAYESSRTGKVVEIR